MMNNDIDWEKDCMDWIEIESNGKLECSLNYIIENDKSITYIVESDGNTWEYTDKEKAKNHYNKIVEKKSKIQTK